MKPGAQRRVSTGAALVGLCTTTALALMTAGAAAAEPSQDWTAPIGSSSSPQVIEAFDPPSKPWLAGHRGVDLAASVGAPVRAAGAGTITFAGQLAGRGVVTVTHGELRTTYEPVDATVGYGQHVARGDVIGTVGFGSHCSVTCVHWGLLRGDEYLDPLLLLSWEPPVLKSLGRGSGQSSARQESRSEESAPQARQALRPQQPRSAASPPVDDGEARGALPTGSEDRQAGPTETASGGPSALAGAGVIAGSLLGAGLVTWRVKKSRR